MLLYRVYELVVIIAAFMMYISVHGGLRLLGMNGVVGSRLGFCNALQSREAAVIPKAAAVLPSPAIASSQIIV